jgi:ribA/ribD-fused uncharacterized protein
MFAQTASINSFRGEHRFLSNFYPAIVKLEGVLYPTVEHAFQAAKTTDQRLRAEIRNCETAADAKQLGRRVPLRPDWDAVKVLIMENFVRQKFAPGSNLAARLIATGNAVLVEGNDWGDTFWGVCRGKGENMMGRILMLVRAELLSADGSRKEGVAEG